MPNKFTILDLRSVMSGEMLETATILSGGYAVGYFSNEIPSDILACPVMLIDYDTDGKIEVWI